MLMTKYVMAELPIYESLRCAIYREKRKQQSVLPSQASDITSNLPHSETLNRRDFLRFSRSSQAG